MPTMFPIPVNPSDLPRHSITLQIPLMNGRQVSGISTPGTSVQRAVGRKTHCVRTVFKVHRMAAHPTGGQPDLRERSECVCTHVEKARLQTYRPDVQSLSRCSAVM